MKNSEIKKLLDERLILQTRINKIDKAINALRDLCNHTDEKGKDAFEWVGNDSHKDHYKCAVCGESNSI